MAFPLRRGPFLHDHYGLVECFGSIRCLALMRCCCNCNNGMHWYLRLAQYFYAGAMYVCAKLEGIVTYRHPSTFSAYSDTTAPIL